MTDNGENVFDKALWPTALYQKRFMKTNSVDFNCLEVKT